MEYRIEHDSMGEVKVPADKYWAAQTQRSSQNFPIGVGLETMPREITHAFGILKKAAAMANHSLKPEKMTDEKLAAISQACDEVMSGSLNAHFPLVVWQTGSGTQSNMNANEVIANRGNEIAGKKLLHPNDDVNMSQSSNDTFPTAMHISAVIAIEDKVLPAIDKLVATFQRLETENEGIVKSGRTHLQDATPIAFSQEISGWRSTLERDKEMLQAALPFLKTLALGGTAVGTGLNTPKGFDVAVAKAVSEITGKEFRTAENKFHALTSKDELVFAHGALKALAADMMKIANDVRWLASGPRDGLGEIFIPENEPGSSIMPGKVNPTQFGPNEDLEAYPRDFERDSKLCESLGADLIFAPSPEDMYHDPHAFVSIDTLSETLCGKTRPIHFKGVCTVVTKLFHIVAPDRAYFGEKDAQQLAIIRKMVKDLNFDIEIVGCPIVREEDGLAKSSRNTYLNDKERQAALCLSRAVKTGKEVIYTGADAKEVLNPMKAIIEAEPLARIDYVMMVDALTMQPIEKADRDVLVAMAVYIGKTRLIDNFSYGV